ncbi:MAG: hypothetical protein LQ351_002266 [Letrouitia transgressa]|nr:MAG: hypothetical protein LQ351_002266 [Letrouitia transgressa]
MGLYTNFTPGEVGVAAVVFPVIGTVLVTIRTSVKRRNAKKLGIEDWLVFPALAEGYVTPFTKGAHKEYTEIIVEQVFWNTEWMQPLALGCIKLSFIFFYRRIFNVGINTAVFNIVSLASLFLMAVWMLGFFLAVMLICPGHIDAYWALPTVRAKYCWTTTKFLYALSWSDVGTDLIVFLMPIPSVARLHMTSLKKIAVIAIFSLGALTLAASIIRAVFYVQLLNAEKTAAATYDSNSESLTQLVSIILSNAVSTTVINTNGLYWMLVETGLALIAVNLPLLYGSFRHHGIETVVQKVRSFTSIRSHGSNSEKASKSSPMRKASDDSHHRGKLVGLVYGVEASSDSTATRTMSVDPRDMEEGKINITSTYGVDQR